MAQGVVRLKWTGPLKNQHPPGIFDAGAANPLELGLVVGVLSKFGFDLHRESESGGEDRQDENGYHDDDEGNAGLGSEGVMRDARSVIGEM